MRKINFAPNEYYHLYNRGSDRRIIFNNDTDYHRFLMLLYLCNSEERVDLANLPKTTLTEIFNFDRKEELVHIGAYCLMPNHFHLLVFEKKEDGISSFMHKLQTAYSMYFNRKHDRSGTLFQGRFQAKHAAEESYLMYLFAYIHLNPIKLIEPNWKEKGIQNKAAARRYLATYPYSSYLDFIGASRSEGSILNHSSFPNYFDSEKTFEDFMDWLDKGKELQWS